MNREVPLLIPDAQRWPLAGLTGEEAGVKTREGDVWLALAQKRKGTKTHGG
jgi:hypothetical protein